jgi:hypothetical protein
MNKNTILKTLLNSNYFMKESFENSEYSSPLEAFEHFTAEEAKISQKAFEKARGHDNESAVTAAAQIFGGNTEFVAQELELNGQDDYDSF